MELSTYIYILFIAEEGRMEPSRILEKKGSKYLVLWEGKQQLKTWETSKNLICFPLMKEFDDGTEDDSEDEIYEVKVNSWDCL